MKFVIFAVSLTIASLSGGVESVRVETVQSQDKRYTDNGDGTISDSKTGLMWMKNDSYLHSGHWLNWHEAKDYVEELNKIGIFKADINFHSEVRATISIKIDKIQSK